MVWFWKIAYQKSNIYNCTLRYTVSPTPWIPSIPCRIAFLYRFLLKSSFASRILWFFQLGIFDNIMSSTATETTTAPQQTSIRIQPQQQEDYAPMVTSGENDAYFQSTTRGNRSGTLKLRGIPIHKDLYAKRKWMKEHMAAAFRFFGQKGYGEGAAGHISMRGKSQDQYQYPYRYNMRLFLIPSNQLMHLVGEGFYCFKIGRVWILESANTSLSNHQILS